MEERFDDLETKEPGGRRILLIALLLVLLAAAFGILWTIRGRQRPEAAEPAVLPGGILELDALPAGDGACFLLLSPNGKTMLVGAGTAESVPGIVSALESRGIRAVDVLVLNLPGEEAAAGAEALLGAVPVGSLWVSPLWTDETFLSGVLKTAGGHGTEIRSAYGSSNSFLDWDPDVEVRILSPYTAAYPDSADSGLVLRVRYGSSGVLLPGAVSELTEKLVVKALPDQLLHADILTASPGSGGGADSKKFLGAVKPLFVLCSGESAKPGSAARGRIRDAGAETVVPGYGETVRFLLDGAEARMIE